MNLTKRHRQYRPAAAAVMGSQCCLNTPCARLYCSPTASDVLAQLALMSGPFMQATLLADRSWRRFLGVYPEYCLVFRKRYCLR